MRIVGWLCVLGVTLMIVDFAWCLGTLPEEWWGPEQAVRVDATGVHFDLRWMAVDFGLAWLGQWGYLAAFIWIPTAVVRFLKARRASQVALPSERILFATLCALMLALTALVHLTPLRYPSYNVIVL